MRTSNSEKLYAETFRKWVTELQTIAAKNGHSKVVMGARRTLATLRREKLLSPISKPHSRTGELGELPKGIVHERCKH